MTLPGVARTRAHAILAEIADAPLEFFANSARPAAWAGVARGNNESVGKRRSGRAWKGNPRIGSGCDPANSKANSRIRTVPWGRALPFPSPDPLPPDEGQEVRPEARGSAGVADRLGAGRMIASFVQTLRQSLRRNHFAPNRAAMYLSASFAPSRTVREPRRT